ncbi:CTAG/Pcc1 family [Lipomyces arxii]|uniref:CTAG/Pcc1 family n=1 Tax=Lipomyces arxii TaxID=56418 RepID=UPI0034CD1E63
MTQHNHKLTVTIPFETIRQAEIAYKAISPDPQLKPDQFTQELLVGQSNTSLVAKFTAVSDRVLRVGVNGFMESLGVVVGCLKDLDVKAV